MQNVLFRFFSDVLNSVIVDARRNGSWDLGILGEHRPPFSSQPEWFCLVEDLGTGEETVAVERTQIFVLPTQPLQVELHEIVVERGIAFGKAVQLNEHSSNPEDGFYMSKETDQFCHLVVLALSSTTNVNMGNFRRNEQLFRIYRPNTGLQQRHETLESLRKKYDKVRSKEKKNAFTSFVRRSHRFKLSPIGKTSIRKPRAFAFTR